MTHPIAHAQIYAARRARLAAQLGDGGVAIIPTAPVGSVPTVKAANLTELSNAAAPVVAIVNPEPLPKVPLQESNLTPLAVSP